MHTRPVLGLLLLAGACGGGGTASTPDAAPVVQADAAQLAPDAATARDAAAPDLTDYLTRDVRGMVALAGTWAPDDVPGVGLVDFWGVVKLGAGQLEGVV